MSIPKVNEKYESGQFFLHRIFGYRGVVLFPWRVKVYDRNPYYPTYADAPNQSEKGNAIEQPAETPPTDAPTQSQPQQKDSSPDLSDEATVSRPDDKKEVTVNLQTYYQVLIDARDCPHVVWTRLIYFDIFGRSGWPSWESGKSQTFQKR